MALILAPYLQGAAVSTPISEPQSAAEPRIGTAQCLTSREVMDRLRISREKLRKLIHSGELDAFKISGRPTSDLRVTEEASLSAMPSPLTGSGPRKPSAALA